MTSRIRLTRTRVAAVLALLGALAGALVPADRIQAAQPSPLPDVMRVKLEHAQAVLRALVTEDFSGLERAAGQLGALTKQPSWGLLKTPEYARHSADFQRATDELAASARVGDLSAATLGYATLTVRCVQCHRHVKGVRQAD